MLGALSTKAVAGAPRAVSLGIKAMPRTGGGGGMPTTPALPIIASLALLLLGGVIRKLAAIAR